MGFILLLSISTTTQAYSDLDSVTDLPKNTKVKIIQPINLDFSQWEYLSPNGINHDRKFCTITVKDGVTANQNIHI